MKLTEIVNNDTNPEEVANTLIRNCHLHIQECLNHIPDPEQAFSFDDYKDSSLIFRGLRTIVRNPLQPITVNKNRKPVDTDSVVHYYADEWFNRQFGKRFRSTSIFTTGSLSQSSTYDFPHVVFIKGDYDFCWSPYVKDFYINYGILPRIIQEAARINKKPVEYYENQLEQGNITREQLISDLIDIVLPHAGYRTTNYGKAVNSHVEIMFECDAYYAIESVFYRDKVQPALIQMLKRNAGE